MTITQEEWELLLDKYPQCLCCGTSDLPLTKDHVIPIAQGGEDIVENAQVLCSICNSEKGDKAIDYRGSKKFSGKDVSKNCWYSIKQAANFLDKSPETIRYYIRKNLIPHITGTDGRKYVWIVDEGDIMKNELISLTQKVDLLFSLVKEKLP